MEYKQKPFLLSLVFYFLMLAISCCTLGFVRGVQLFVFYAPFPLILTCNLPKFVKNFVLLLTATISLIIISFCCIQGFLYEHYDASLKSTFVIEALANTNPTEAKDYLTTSLGSLLSWGLFFTVISSLIIFILFKLKEKHSSPPKIKRIFIFLFSLLFLFSFYQEAWRNKFPVFVYTSFYKSALNLKNAWANLEKENAEYLIRAKQNISNVLDGPRTIVLIIGESTSREDMSVYGYKRDTTPLLNRIEAEDSNFIKVNEAFSTRFSTVSAFNSMLKFNARDENQNVLAFLKAAGYHITWISNQDDSAIKGQYANFADDLVQLNRQRGRSSSSMDEDVLPELKKALATPYPKKLIVIHLIGLHPHFSLRYSPDTKATWPDNDTVQKQLIEKKRSKRTIVLKDQYDLGMLYQDRVLSEAFKISKAFDKSGPLTWVFLSDHGVETGNRGDFIGHSSKTIGGYSIPFFYWCSDQESKRDRAKFAQRPFRADWLSFLLLDLAKIPCKFPYSEKSWSNADYQWKEPSVIQKLKNAKETGS